MHYSNPHALPHTVGRALMGDAWANDADRTTRKETYQPADRARSQTMTVVNSTLVVAGTNVVLRGVEHSPGVVAFADYMVDDEFENPLGRVWEHEGRWRAKTTAASRFIEVDKLLDALDLVVRLANTEHL